MFSVLITGLSTGEKFKIYDFMESDKPKFIDPFKLIIWFKPSIEIGDLFIFSLITSLKINLQLFELIKDIFQIEFLTLLNIW